MDNAGGLGRSRVCPWLLSLFFLVLYSFHSPVAWGQVTSGSLTGVVSDPSGAVIPGAKVVLTDTNKGYTYPTTTDDVGRYLITNLPPSTYKITVQNPGFKTFTQLGIIIDVGTTLSADAHMQVGATAQTVEVVGVRPVLATQDAVTGQEIDRSQLNDLPLYGRSVLDLAFLAPGVSQGVGKAYGPGGTNDFVSNGGRNDTAELLINGVSATTYDANTANVDVLYTPSVDSVQEFKLVQNNYSAEEGFSGGTYINMVLRSGTNAFHGSVYEFLRNNALNANNFFSNKSGGKLGPTRQNQYGMTLGGPIRKNKTFFFVDWEGTRAQSGVTKSGGVPSQAMRQGDFKEICQSGFNSSGICQDANGANQLWDPYSGIYSAAAGGRILQTPIPYNNMALYQSAGNANLTGTPFQLAAVPGNLIDPVTSKMMSYYPLPNMGVGTASYNRFYNWTGSGVSPSANDQSDIRIDHHFTENTSLNARFSLAQGTSHSWNCFGNVMDPCTAGPQVQNARSVALILNHTFSPTTLFSVSLGFSRSWTYTGGIAKDYPNFSPVTTLGEPAYITTDGTLSAPTVSIGSGYYSVAGNSIGTQGYSMYRNSGEVYQLLPILTQMRGHHEIKFGGEWRVNQINYIQDSRPGGQYSITQFGTSQYVNKGGGDAMATFLEGGIGGGGSGSYVISPHFTTQNYRWGGFVQDNWRTTSRLTVNMGLRYDLEIPRTERYNRESWFDPNAKPTIQPPAISAATWPAGLPYLPDVTHPTGGLVFASNSQRHIVDTYYKGLGPRLGLAYKINNNLVFRSGYGLFYNPTRWGTSGGANLGNEGFAGSTSWLNTMNGDGVTPWARLSNPYPSGLVIPTGPSLGANTNLGGAMQEPERQDSLNPPTTQTWSGGFQYQLPHNWLIDANYVGTKGTHLYYYYAGSLQVLGKWVEQEATNPALVTALNTMVPNPYYGVITTPGCGICGPTRTASSLMVNVPYFNGAWHNFLPVANSSYNALQLRVEKRMSNGMSMLITYTNSKSIDDAASSTYNVDSAYSETRDPNDWKLERSISEWDISQLLQATYGWQLPFGKGKRFGGNLHPVVNALVGGWQTNGIWRFDTGQPITVTASGGLCPASYYQCPFPDQTGPLKVNPKSLWLTQGYYANAASVLSVPPHYTISTAPRTQPNVRYPGTNNASLSMFKEMSLDKMRDGAHLEFRVEAFNAFNHPQFGGISNTFNTGSFGTVGSQVNSPREVQLALKLLF